MTPHTSHHQISVGTGNYQANCYTSTSQYRREETEKTPNGVWSQIQARSRPTIHLTLCYSPFGAYDLSQPNCLPRFHYELDELDYTDVICGGRPKLVLGDNGSFR